MSSIPSNLSRTPNALLTQLARSSLARTNVDMLELSQQIYTNRRIVRPSDDPVGASLLSVVNSRLAATEQRLRNFDHATSTLSTLDHTLGEITELAQSAKTIASDQLGSTSDATTRKAQAQVVESLIQELFALSNSKFADLHLLAGERTGAPPVQRFLDGFRYTGRADGLYTDLGDQLATPITIGADQALGALSSRVEGHVDLNPAVTLSTRITDLDGARGLGVAPGAIRISIDDGTPPPTDVSVDLTGAVTVGEALTAIESAIRAADVGALSGAFPGGVAVNGTGNGVAFNVAGGYTLTITDLGGGTTGADLGLTGPALVGPVASQAADLAPRLTPATAFGSLNPTAPFSPGDIVFRNGGRTGTVSVDATTTVADFQRAVAALGLGLRAEISADGRSLNVVNEVSGHRMSIEESGGGTLTAASLGIRSYSASTSLGTFNAGRGVGIAHGQINPVTGLPDANRNVDFEIALSDGTTFNVDLVPADLVSVQGVVSAINVAALAAGLALGTGPNEFFAGLGDGPNGIVLQDTLGGTSFVSVRSLNGTAAEDLGLLAGAGSAGPPASLRAEDRATVRVNSLFSTLIELKVALETNDTRGIAFAGERLESDLDLILSARAVVGGRAQRIEAAQRREEDTQLLDKTVKSSIEDLDLVDASSRFSLLQLVQQASYAVAGRSQSLTLLDFLR